MSKKLIDCVFEGGGALGVAYVGVLQSLEERGFWPARVLGTSAGAIFAALVAAGYNASEIAEIITNTDFSSFKDSSVSWFQAVMGKRAGFYKGDVFRNWMEDMLQGKTMLKSARFGDLKMPLTVTAADITTGQQLVLNEHTVGIHLPVSLAVRMSMSIPVFYEPVVWDAQGFYQGRGTIRCVDGGILSNYPLHLFMEPNVYVKNAPVDFARSTVGFLLDEKISLKAFALRQQFRILDDAICTLQTVLQHRDRENRSRYGENTVLIDIPRGFSALDFSLSRDQKLRLIECGRRAAEGYFAKSGGELSISS